MKLDKLLTDGDISENHAKKFYRAVLQSYQTAFSYATERLPHGDVLLMNAKLINFNERENVNLSQMEYFISRFPHLLPFSSPNEMDHLVDEMHCYQLMDHDSIPKVVCEEASTSGAPDNGAGNAAHGDIHSDWRRNTELHRKAEVCRRNIEIPKIGKDSPTYPTMGRTTAGRANLHGLLKQIASYKLIATTLSTYFLTDCIDLLSKSLQMANITYCHTKAQIQL